MRGRRRPLFGLALGVLGLAFAPASAGAAFGLLPGTAGFDIAMKRDGVPAQGAGIHPDRMDIHIGLAMDGAHSDGDLRDLRLDLPAGLLANPEAVEECSQARFFAPRESPYEASLSGENCPDEAQVGVVAVRSSYGGGVTRHFGVFNLTAPYGSAEAIGFAPFGVPMIFTARLRDSDQGLAFELKNLSRAVNIQAIDLTLWGTPWDYHHDVERGNCLNEVDPADYHGVASHEEPGKGIVGGTCWVPLSASYVNSYLTLPTTCGEPMEWAVAAASWQQPGTAAASELLRDGKGDPVLVNDCIEVLTRPKMQLRTDRAAVATGIEFKLNVEDGGGFLNENGRVRSPIREARAFLPEGLTINPSLGAGLGVCTEAEFARESASSPPGAGCPNASKIGGVSTVALLGLAETVQGSVFLAEPYANPDGSLIALYITLASPRRGLFLRSFGRVEPDPTTGRLVVTFENLPPLHYDDFTLNLREGQRAAMISPPTCGTHVAQLESRPWSDPNLVLREPSAFGIHRGEDGGACPTGGLPPFHPGLTAGSVNPNAGSYTPFKLRMTRTDAEQEITSYSATFPPGLLAKLAGVTTCSDAAIAAAKARTGPRGGREELDAPSCPASSLIGHTIAGYGVGGVLAYAPGALYLAGPYHGAPLSTVAIDSALVGPFDLGVVVVRSAIRVDPRTAQASIDSAGSDPIPHIIRGIPIHLRDIRVDVDRPGFTVNPTNCDPLATTSTLTGSGADLFSPGDDVTATASNRYKLSNCSAYGFKPRLSLKLSGGTKRGRYPGLRAVYVPRPGDANIKQAAVSLPNSIFLAQEHIQDVCTMVQFRAKACPRGSRLGFATAVTPLLDEPLRGPVYVRSSTHVLPDLVASINGRGFEIEVVGRVGKSRQGGMRASFDSLPDAPVSRFTMNLFGSERGLLVNSDNLCLVGKPATARFIAHNNATASLNPRLRVRCRGDRNAGRRGKR